MSLISGTYSDGESVKRFIDTDLYDASTLSADIAAQADLARDEVNTFIGREANFTTTELAEVKNKGIVLAASRLTAYFMELRRQERQGRIAEDTKIDRDDAFKTLERWMLNNGLTPPSRKAGTSNVPREILAVCTGEEYSIGGRL